MSDVWRKDAVGYPPQFAAILAVMIRLHALAWIDENKPFAWYRPMFVDSPAPPDDESPVGQGAAQS